MKCILNWGDVATWVTGIATIALFVVGFIQISTERKSRMKSESRAQAELVSCWIVKEDQDLTWIVVQNYSSQPIYEVVVSRVRVGQLGDSLEEYIGGGQRYIPIAPPGTGYVWVHQFTIGMMHHTGFEIAFRDTVGRNWVRKPNGELSQIKESPVAYYKISLPLGWTELLTSLPSDNSLYV
jgi:hypothetical protein